MHVVPLFLALLIAGYASGQSPAEKSIRNLLAAQEAAWNRGDLEAFMAGYRKSDALQFIGKSGVTYGWASTLENYKRGYPDSSAMGKLNFRLLQVKRLSSRYYHVLGKWQLRRSIGDVGGHFTLLFRRIRGRWLIVSDHSS